MPLLNISALSFHVQEVVVDFEAHAISDSDFSGIKKLLQQVCTLLFYTVQRAAWPD